MGYTHNWKITLPPAQQQEALQAIEIELRSRFSATMAIEMDDDGVLHLYSLDGVSEGFQIGQSGLNESCKTGRGLAELDIAQILWRTSALVHAHGGEMEIRSDWTAATNTQDINHDAKVALAVLVERCHDLIEGKTLEIKAIPRAWPSTYKHRDLAVEERCMKRNRTADCVVTKYWSAPEQLVFGIDTDGAVNYTERHTPGNLKFDYLVTRHIQAARQQPEDQQVVRGFFYADLAVYLDERLIAGEVPNTDPVVSNNTRNLTQQAPWWGAWITAEEQSRREEELEEVQ